MENTNVSASVHGIKCDNPECDYEDMSVKFEDYHLWLNKPCPKCGANLLTEADYKLVNKMMKISHVVDKLFSFFSIFSKKKHEKKDNMTITYNFNGTGKATLTDISIKESS